MTALDEQHITMLTEELLSCIRAHYGRRPRAHSTAQEVLNAAAVVTAFIIGGARAAGDEAGARKFFETALANQLGQLAEDRAARAQQAQAPALATPRNVVPYIGSLYCYLSKDPQGNEGLCAGPVGPGGMMLPLIASDAERLKSLTPAAEIIAQATGWTIMLVEFTERRELRPIMGPLS